MAHELAHGFLDLVVGVQRGLEEIDVEGDAERGQVEVLLAAQPGDGEAADRVDVVGIAGGVDDVTVGIRAIELHRGAIEIGLGDVLDVVAAVTVLRPAGVVGRRGPWRAPARTWRGCRSARRRRCNRTRAPLPSRWPRARARCSRRSPRHGRGRRAADRWDWPRRIRRRRGDPGRNRCGRSARPARAPARASRCQAEAAEPEIEEARSGDFDRCDLVARGQARRSAPARARADCCAPAWPAAARRWSRNRHGCDPSAVRRRSPGWRDRSARCRRRARRRCPGRSGRGAGFSRGLRGVAMAATFYVTAGHGVGRGLQWRRRRRWFLCLSSRAQRGICFMLTVACMKQIPRCARDDILCMG